MIRVDITKRRVAYVNAIPDTSPNKGGYYCQVFHDPNGEFEMGSFTLSKNQFTQNHTKEQLVRAVTNRVKQDF